MKLSIDLKVNSRGEWLEAVMNDFPSFIQDHANCERKASAMAMHLVAKYPDRLAIIPELIATAVEELEHFQQVYAFMEKMKIPLKQEMGEDPYIKQLLMHCRTGRDERFLDRLLIASVVECRGAERFKLIWQALEEGELKKFYHHLWASEAKHGHIFVKMALAYFPQEVVYNRLEFWMQKEAEAIQSLPIHAALH
ncbi:MAG: tRNA-(ms[2]io[6]A)-hydroxylase [Bacteroidia bacterium]|nr:tRNA-(ms[2]io[6]A)-hydroxylase [Bacteroidia bacterium]MDW8158283.1 tRNA-(ms[2]io[6]A)-hydroxylase [Bacteroidia bacterium]